MTNDSSGDIMQRMSIVHTVPLRFTVQQTAADTDAVAKIQLPFRGAILLGIQTRYSLITDNHNEHEIFALTVSPDAIQSSPLNYVPGEIYTRHTRVWAAAAATDYYMVELSKYDTLPNIFVDTEVLYGHLRTISASLPVTLFGVLHIRQAYQMPASMGQGAIGQGR